MPGMIGKEMPDAQPSSDQFASGLRSRTEGG